MQAGIEEVMKMIVGSEEYTAIGAAAPRVRALTSMQSVLLSLRLGVLLCCMRQVGGLASNCMITRSSC